MTHGLILLIGALALVIWLGGVIVNKSSKIATAFRLSKPKPAFVPEAPEGSIPRAGSRRWARALYWNGLISLSELQAFYASHLEDFSDPDR